MEESSAVDVLIELSDIANCISGDMHTMHLNITGPEFDTMHKDVLKKYYEAAADDYDSLAEMARRKPWRGLVPAKNECALRIDWRSFTGECDRAKAVSEINDRLGLYLEYLHKVFVYFNKQIDCPQSQGIASFIQDRLNFWGAKWGFFNAGRS